MFVTNKKAPQRQLRGKQQKRLSAAGNSAPIKAVVKLKIKAAQVNKQTTFSAISKVEVGLGYAHHHSPVCLLLLAKGAVEKNL